MIYIGVKNKAVVVLDSNPPRVLERWELPENFQDRAPRLLELASSLSNPPVFIICCNGVGEFVQSELMRLGWKHFHKQDVGFFLTRNNKFMLLDLLTQVVKAGVLDADLSSIVKNSKRLTVEADDVTIAMAMALYASEKEEIAV